MSSCKTLDVVYLGCMSDPTLTTTVAVARRLAEQHPAVKLPCPACAAEVKGENLDKHLHKVHALEPGESTGPVVLAGGDRRIIVVSLVVLFATMFGTMPVVALAPPSLGRPLAGVAAVLLLAALGFMFAAYMGKFRARVTIDDAGIYTRWLLGLGNRKVTFPVTIATGGLRKRRSSSVSPLSRQPDYAQPGTVHSAGGYIALTGANGRSIVLGAKNAPRLGKYWDEATFEKSGPRFSWDVQLDAAQLAQLQYVLADRDALRLRPPNP